jgi:hypothetical protein
VDAIDVTAHFSSSGEITPLRFRWNGQEYLVESTGRRWQSGDGCHILVMIPSGRMFELLFTPENRWYVVGQSGLERLAV